MKHIKIFLNKKKPKSASNLVSNIEIFQNKKQKKCQYGRDLLEDKCRKDLSRMQRIKVPEYKTFFIISTLDWDIEYKKLFEQSIRNLFRVGCFGKNVIIFFRVGFFGGFFSFAINFSSLKEAKLN